MAVEVESRPMAPEAVPRGQWQRWLGRDFALAYLLLLPLILILFILLAYPIASAIWITLQSKTIGMVGRFVGLQNYRELLFNDPFFWQVVRNGFVFTLGSVFLKLIVGMIMAIVLNQPLRWRGLWRGLLLMPWVAPTVVTALSWRWILDLTGVLNLTLRDLGLMSIPIPWLAQYGTALLSLVLVNTWRGFPFFGITLLAGMQAIPQELYEAAEMDGASVWQRFRFVTLPSLRTVILVVTILSVIWTFNDFSIVWLLTGGGPGHATDVFATYTYKLGFITSRLGYGQTVSVILAPVLIVIIMILSPLMLRGESE
ncbi:MAG: sugar ABC transporter permease [Caldilineaceae bacterium]|nr:sugar ABC transporter permease [Caldilineaceae bacterium]